MEFKKENLLTVYTSYKDDTATTEETIEEIIEYRAMGLYKIAEFLNDFFNDEYNEEIFQMRCEWCRIQLDKPFFDKLTEASKCQDQEQRLKIMLELHVYVEDFLITFCEEFFKRVDKKNRKWLIYAAHFLHFRMKSEKLDKFFYITGMLKKE